MGTYRKPQSTDLETGTGASVRAISPAQAALEATRGFTKTFGDRVKAVTDFENQAAERDRQLAEKVANLEDLDPLNPFNDLKGEFEDLVTNLYKLDISSFEGDRSEYNKELAKINRLLGNYQGIMSSIEGTLEEYNSKSPEELKRKVARSSWIGPDGEQRLKYLELVNDPSKMGFKIKDGDIVVTYDGEDLFSGTQYLNSTKKGFGLVEYTPDMSEKIDAAGEKEYKGLGNLEQQKIIQSINLGKNYNTLTQVEKTSYNNAIEEYRRRLNESTDLAATVNESTFQRFIDDPNVYDKNKDADRTKQAIIDYLVKRKFPQSEVIKKEQTKITGATTAGQRIKGKDKDIQIKPLDFSKTFDILESDPYIKFKKVIKNIGGENFNEELIQEFRNTEDIKDLKASLNPYINKEIKIGNVNRQIAEFEIDVDSDGDIVLKPLYIENGKLMEGVKYKFDKDGMVSFENDLLQAGKEQFRESTAVTTGFDPKQDYK
tara:strand:+ start:4273 stop:5736 length:1464 start_codon:yes stop_codon:yes gene_type:complete